MGGVLDGVRVVEVSMWAMVPAAAAVLGEWGADVLKIEGPDGDPVRGLVIAGLIPGGPQFTWEMWNRGKRAIALDLNLPEGKEILYQAVAQADVFLTSILPGQRQKLGIDAESIQAANPTIIYASGTGSGPLGPDGNKGGYDGITFWARSGMADAATAPGSNPVTMPAAAFGDALSGLVLAGGVAAALAQKARTGQGAVVEGSLLATAMWAMQSSITGALAAGLEQFPRTDRFHPYNVLVNTYKTADGRWLALSMLQADRYWPGLCKAIGREDLLADERFVDAQARARNVEACVAEFDKTFAAEPLSVWRERLATQEGQWEVLNRAVEVLADPQVEANHFAHKVAYDGDHELTLIGSPVQFDGQPPVLRPAPAFAGNTDEVLAELGWNEEQILNAKISGAVV
jgi:crotonobetainyl-CoA:carnitine CoA-transferase CaiB-like acyl-CoA transferase